MPVKAKRSTYNYSLPITVKKTCKWLDCLHQDMRGGGHSDSTVAGLMAIPYRQVQKVRQIDAHPRCTEALPCSHTANQPVTMHDLKQGLGPSGTEGPRKLTYNKYKLKVSAPRLQC